MSIEAFFRIINDGINYVCVTAPANVQMLLQTTNEYRKEAELL